MHQTKTITRQVFGTVPTCTFGLVTDLTTAYNYQDLWWASPAGAEVGMGPQPHASGRPDLRDLVHLRTRRQRPRGWRRRCRSTAAGVYAGKLYAHDRPRVQCRPVRSGAGDALRRSGSATLTFTDGNTGTFAYTLDGITQTKAITRQVFRTPGTVCQ